MHPNTIDVHVPFIVSWPGVLPASEVRDDLVSLIDMAATSLAIAGVTVPSYRESKSFLETTGTHIGDHINIRNYVMLMRDKMDETIDKIRGVRTKRFKYLRNYYPELPWTPGNKYKGGYATMREAKNLYREGKLNPVQAAFFASTKPEEELYDLSVDPWETNNLAGNSSNFDTLFLMRERLQT